MIVKCQECGKEISFGNKKRRFCSDYCKNKYHLRDKSLKQPTIGTCERCSKEYTKTRQDQRYCSKNCARAGWKKDRIASGLCPRCGILSIYNDSGMCALCINRRRVLQKKMRYKNKDSVELKNKRKIFIVTHREKIKSILLSIYGNKCSCCGCSTREFLTLEHKNGDGTEHRKNTGSSLRTWKEAIKNVDYGKYTILCMNCNWYQRFGKECPCKKEINVKNVNHYEDYLRE